MTISILEDLTGYKTSETISTRNNYAVKYIIYIVIDEKIIEKQKKNKEKNIELNCYFLLSSVKITWT